MVRAEFEFSGHALDMLEERGILEEWVWRTISSLDYTEIGTDENTHYIKTIREFDGRAIRVVINPHVTPNRIVTFFFDRRLRIRS